MDYPRALDSSPEDRGLGVRDCDTMLYNPRDSSDVQLCLQTAVAAPVLATRVVPLVLRQRTVESTGEGAEGGVFSSSSISLGVCNGSGGFSGVFLRSIRFLRNVPEGVSIS